MHVSGAQSNFDVNAQAELAGELQDLQMDEFEDNADVDEADESEEVSREDKRRKFGRKGDAGKKKSKKPASVALLKGEFNDRDLLNQQSEKASQSRVKKGREALHQKLQAEYRESVEDMMGTGKRGRLKDTISISANFHKEQAAKLKNDELSKLVKPTTSVAEDLAATDLDQGRETKLQKQQRNTTIKLSKEKMEQSRQINDTLQSYVSSLSESLLEEKPKKKEEVRQLRDLLQQKGLSTKKLNIIEKNVATYLRKDIKRKLKQSFLETTMFYSTQKNSRDTIAKFYNYKEMMVFGEKLGVFNEGINEEEKYKQETKFDARNFIAHELDSSIAETRLRTDSIKELVKAFDKFNGLAGFSGFNAGEYMKDLNQKLNDQGLTHFVNPNAAQQSYLDTQTGGRKKKQQDEEMSEDDVESAEDMLRSLYIKKHTSSVSIVKMAKMKLKIMKYEKQMRLAGKGELVDKLKKEGAHVAHFKLTVKLRSTFEERATLPELKGTRYRINKKQLKDTLKGLKTLGRPVTKSDMINVRDQANRSMFTLIKEEYIKLEVHQQSSPRDRNISFKLKEYKMTLDRLKAESKIKESIKPKLMQDLSFLSDLNVVEAA